MSDLAALIEKLTSRIPFSALKKASDELSLAYRAQTEGIKAPKYMTKMEHKLAYLALRMPATYAAINEVLKHIPSPIHSLLDVGSGPATAYLAAKSHFPELAEADLIESDPDMVRISRELVQSHYLMQPIESYTHQKSYDLVMAAYSLGELPDEETLTHVLQELWKSSGKYLCIIEPGTPYGFKTILQARKQLIASQGHIVAPCTHEVACPMQVGRDWCHFSVRFARTKLQRRVKEASLGYEDEKYSYLIVSKQSRQKPESRIVKTPVKRSGFIQ